MKKRLQILHKILPLIIGISLVFKGYTELLHYPVIGSIIFCSGVILILYFGYELIKKRQSHTLILLVHLFEGVALFFLAYIYFDEGKVYIQYVVLAAALALLIYGIIMLFVNRKKH